MNEKQKSHKKKRMLDIINTLPADKKGMVRDSILRNAYYLIEDGKSLYKQGSNGHAFGLLAIACEEIAKVNMMEMNRINNTNKDIMKNHMEKHRALAASTFARYVPVLIKDLLEQRFNGQIPNDLDSVDRVFQEVIVTFIKEFQTNAALRVKFQQRVYLFGIHRADVTGQDQYEPGQLEYMRQKSLYVDLIEDENGIGVFSPSKFPKENTEAIIQIAQEDFYYTDLFYNEGKLVKEFNISKPISR